MTLLPRTRLRFFLLGAALFLPAALFVVVFLASEPPSQPQVLGERAPTIIQQPTPPAPPAQPELVKALDLDTVQAKSFLVYDVKSQALLARNNENYPLPVASLTKLLTAYIAHQRLDLTTEFVAISNVQHADVSPALGLRTEDKVKAVDLFNAMLIGSANDAAQVLADHVATKTGLSIKELMNQTAKELGMTASRFSNPMGFDSDTNYSTAADLRVLVNATRQHKAFTELGREMSYSFKSAKGYSYSVKTTNKLLTTDPEISAIKTGFTDEAQGAMITEVNHQDHKFIIIVLGSPNREQDTLKLKRAIIGSYQWAN